MFKFRGTVRNLRCVRTLRTPVCRDNHCHTHALLRVTADADLRPANLSMGNSSPTAEGHRANCSRHFEISEFPLQLHTGHGPAGEVFLGQQGVRSRGLISKMDFKFAPNLVPFIWCSQGLILKMDLKFAPKLVPFTWCKPHKPALDRFRTCHKSMRVHRFFHNYALRVHNSANRALRGMTGYLVVSATVLQCRPARTTTSADIVLFGRV